ncbi:hypothetical protein ACGFNY_39260 [Streptomyces chartreusis]|uniref:hypothetical protein n=1 Tax=Streptomyces chartreusis TaxID=1969 RepID=UPI003710369D
MRGGVVRRAHSACLCRRRRRGPVVGSATGVPQHRLEGHTEAVSSLCTIRLPGQHTLLASAGADGVVRLWDPPSGTPRHRLKCHTHRTRSSQAGPGRVSSSSARARPI